MSYHQPSISAFSSTENKAADRNNVQTTTNASSHFSAMSSGEGYKPQSGVSHFEIMAQRTQSLITVVLSSPITSALNSDTANAPANTLKPKRDHLRFQWEQTCLRWGFVVIRKLTYIQTSFHEISSGINTGETISDEKTIQNAGKSSSVNKISINGIEAVKEKDELVISTVVRPSPAHTAGLQEGDIIDAVYGMKDPNLGLLFGIMRDSMTFQLRIKRMESRYERDLRTGSKTNFKPVVININGAAASDVTETEAHANDNSIAKSTQVETFLQVDGGSVRRSKDNKDDADKTLFEYSDDEDYDEICKHYIERENGRNDDVEQDLLGESMETDVEITGSQEKKQFDNTVRNSLSRERQKGRMDENERLALPGDQNYHNVDSNVSDPIDSTGTTHLQNEVETTSKISTIENQTDAAINIENRLGGNGESISIEQHQIPQSTISRNGSEIIDQDTNLKTNSKKVSSMKEKNLLGPEMAEHRISSVVSAKQTASVSVIAKRNKTSDEIPESIRKNKKSSSFWKEEPASEDHLQGWVVHIHRRKNGNIYKYWFSPGGIKFRSMKLTNQFVELLKETCGNEEKAYKCMKDNTRPTLEPIGSTLASSASDDVSTTTFTQNREEAGNHRTTGTMAAGNEVPTNFDAELYTDLVKEETLLTLIEDSIQSSEKEEKESSREKKAQKKAKRRKMSEDSVVSQSSKGSKKEKKSKKRRRQSEDINIDGGRPPLAESTEEKKKKRKTQKATNVVIESGRTESDNDSKKKCKKDRRSSKDVAGDDTKSKEGMKSKKKSKVTNNMGPEDRARAAFDSMVERQQNSNAVSSFLTNLEEEQIRAASPATIPRSSPLTVIRQNSKVTVTSTSAKAGLGAVKSAKLRRLWPDSSVFSKRIMKWCPPEVVIEDFKVLFKGSVKPNIERNKLPVIPSSFRDTSEMIKLITPHILEEGTHSVEQEFLENSDMSGIWTRDVFSMQLRHCTPVDPKPTTNSSSPSVRTYEFAFKLDPNGGNQPPSNLGEIFVIHSPSWKQPCCIGIIGSNEINSTFLSDQRLDSDDSLDLFKLWVCACGNSTESSGWLPDNDMPPKNPDGSFPPQIMYALNIGTCTDMMRQYEGLKSLACIRTNLKRAVYSSDKDEEGPKTNGEIIDTLPSEQLVKPSSVCATVWNHLEKETNPYQLSAIEKIMSGKVKENIALMQGPPGTGKTQTTVALVSALLNGSAPEPGAKSAGTRVQIGRALQNSSSDLVKHNSVVSRRILVCAPSNQAVDELAWKIHNHAIGGNGKVGGFNMVRFGMLPGENRHDGRGKRSFQRASSFSTNERDNFLSAINLDKMVGDVASGREIHDFRHSNKNAQKKNDKGRKSRYINFNVERQKILSQCHVVCCTLSGAGSKAFIESVSRDEFPHSEFDAVIIDEACQGSEMSSLIPFKYNPNIVVLVGDPNQLPVMTFSNEATRCNADRSLFDRLHANGWPINMLRIQYRMHPAIVHFPSKTFYNSNLITCDLIKNRRPALWHDHIAFPPYLLWNVQGGVMHKGSNGGISNNAEANFVVKLLRSFACRYANVRNINIGVISFYSEQVARIKERVTDYRLRQWMKSNNISLQISTVDGFQGCEKDIIILSCVRSRWHGQNARKDIGFLKDFRRVNVALTRAKHSLWVVAHCDTLSSDALWNDLIIDADSRNLIAQSQQLQDFTNFKGGSPKNKKNGKKGKKKNKRQKDEYK